MCLDLIFAFLCLFFLLFPLFLDEVFHNLGKEDHRHPTPVAPRNSPTSLTSLPPLNATSHPSSPNTHLPSIGTQSFPKTVTQTPGFMDVHQGLCLSSGEQHVTPVDGLVSGPNSVCRSVPHLYHLYIFFVIFLLCQHLKHIDKLRYSIPCQA